MHLEVKEILKLVKIEKPGKITLFIADKWKYDFMEKLKNEMKKTRNQADLIKMLIATDLKIYSHEILKLVPKLLNDETKVPQFILGQETEFHALNDASADYGNEFRCKIEVIVAEKTKESKAKQSLPGKVAVLIE